MLGNSRKLPAGYKSHMPFPACGQQALLLRYLKLLIKGDSRPRSRCYACISNFLTGRSCQPTESAVRKVPRSIIGNEAIAGGIEQEALHTATDHNLGHKIALHYCTAQCLRRERCAGTLPEQVDTRTHRAGVGAGQCNLLSHDWGQVAVIGEHELLHIAARSIGVEEREAGSNQRAEYSGREEAEHGVDGAVIGETEAANLIAGIAAVRRIKSVDLGIAEHADLGIHVAQMRDLEDLRNHALEAGIFAGTELS